MQLAVFAKVERAGGGAVDAHFVLDPGAGDIVVHQAAIVTVAQPGHDKNGNPPDPLRRPINASQHHMDDIFGKVVHSRRDKDLLPGYLVGPIVEARGPGASDSRHHSPPAVRSCTWCRPILRRTV